MATPSKLSGLLAIATIVAGCQNKGPAYGCTVLTTEMVKGGQGRQSIVFQRTGIKVPVLICAPDQMSNESHRREDNGTQDPR